MGLILDRATLAAQLTQWLPDRNISLDLETNGRPPWELGSRIVGVSLAGLDPLLGRPSGCYIPLAHQRGPNADPNIVGDLLTYLQRVPLVGFATGVEVMWVLSKWGVRLQFAGDPYIIGRLLSMAEMGLKDMTETVLQRRALRLGDVLPEGSVDFSECTSDDPQTIAYTEADALNPWQLEAALLPRIVEQRLRAVYHLELQTAALMAVQTWAGYDLDPVVLATEMRTEERRVALLAKQIFVQLGGPSFNLNSPVQVGAALQRYGITSLVETVSGKPSYSLEALEAISERHPAIPLLIEWKSATAVIGAMARTGTKRGTDGKLHPRWQSIGVMGSARMYAEQPPLTTFPVRARRALVAPEGWLWVQMAWDHAELRFATAATRDVTMARCLAAPDFYAAFVAATGIPEIAPDHIDACLTQYLHGGAQRLDAWTELVAHAFPFLQHGLIEIEQTAQRSRTVTSWMHRRWKLVEGDPATLGRRGSTALGQQSAGTALKVGLTLLTAHIEMGVAALRGIRQVLPIFDVLNYCLPVDIPLDAHAAQMDRLFSLDLGPVEGVPLQLVCRFSTGPSLGELEPLVLAPTEEAVYATERVERRQVRP